VTVVFTKWGNWETDRVPSCHVNMGVTLLGAKELPEARRDPATDLSYHL
jgi:hypothetical protein